MIVDDFDVQRARLALRPLEADPPLIIDPNAPLPLTVSPQSFQPITGKPRQVA
jgi:hypothetical protein